ncbi:MAG TPA: hypothetical protein VKG45_04035 [Actinomycetes bacterium]|nr:hypothetical protein [Actinomycetes bacterium]
MARRCPRCDLEVPAGKSVCLRCEQPIDRPAGTRHNPAGLAVPSPIQGHATVLVGVAVALLVLGVLAFNAFGGVGPFAARVVDEASRPDRSGITVQLEVTNKGSHAGRARCRVTGRSVDGELETAPELVTDPIPPGRSVQVRLVVDRATRANPLDVSCS